MSETVTQHVPRSLPQQWIGNATPSVDFPHIVRQILIAHFVDMIQEAGELQALFDSWIGWLKDRERTYDTLAHVLREYSQDPHQQFYQCCALAIALTPKACAFPIPWHNGGVSRRKTYLASGDFVDLTVLPRNVREFAGKLVYIIAKGEAGGAWEVSVTELHTLHHYLCQLRISGLFL